MCLLEMTPYSGWNSKTSLSLSCIFHAPPAMHLHPFVVRVSQFFWRTLSFHSSQMHEIVHMHSEQNQRLAWCLRPFHKCVVTSWYSASHLSTSSWCSPCGCALQERFDHHCQVIGNCVGRCNHRFFVIFLISAQVMVAKAWCSWCLSSACFLAK